MNVVLSMLRKLGNISWATSRAQCKLDQFAHATKMAAEDRAAAACIVIALLMEEDDERKTRGPDRDWIKRRKEKGAFQNIVKELAAEDLPSFKNFMRMDYVTFQALVENISPKITKRTTMMRKAISASERVALTLRFLATGESFSSLEYQFRISKRAISYIVIEVCRAIYSEMGDWCFLHQLMIGEQ